MTARHAEILNSQIQTDTAIKSALRPTAYVLLMTVAFAAKFGHLSVTMSNQAVMDATGFCPATVTRAKENLVSLGMLEVDYAFQCAGHGATIYFFPTLIDREV